jgi:hypothetical protein
MTRTCHFDGDMNQREALVILFEATADLPETRDLRRARKVVEKRIEVLRVRYRRRHLLKLFKAVPRYRQLSVSHQNSN